MPHILNALIFLVVCTAAHLALTRFMGRAIDRFQINHAVGTAVIAYLGLTAINLFVR